MKVKTGQASLLNSYFREMIADIRKDYRYLCNFDREKFKFVIKIQILIVIFAMKACEVTSY